VIAVRARIQHVAAAAEDPCHPGEVGEELRYENRHSAAVGDDRVGGGVRYQGQRGQEST
jgi:hypothetical protein